MKSKQKGEPMREDEQVLLFGSQAELAQWLEQHHDKCDGMWLRHAKKGAPAPTVSYQEALEVALCFGWIDGIKRAEDAHYFRQRWSPRRARSIWSKINRDKALLYIEQGKMQPSGLAEVERARKDGRWDAAYDGASQAAVPPDLQAAFDAHPGAEAFFATLNAQNRYAVLFRIQTTTKPETRARKVAQFAAMLARHETLHPVAEKSIHV
jgi:uncharacterized protein YdeI (YjbR/CyaY-like superfamily)